MGYSYQYIDNGINIYYQYIDNAINNYFINNINKIDFFIPLIESELAETSNIHK